MTAFYVLVSLGVGLVALQTLFLVWAVLSGHIRGEMGMTGPVGMTGVRGDRGESCWDDCRCGLDG